jgi:hypothetical protein
MPFELESMTKVRVLDVRVLAAKDRKPDDPPGAQLLLSATLSADALSMFDGALKGQVVRKASAIKQGALEGMEGLELTSFGKHVKRFPWDYEQTGCTVEIDRGMGGKRNITLPDCKAHRLSISPREGGSVVVQWTVDAPGLSDATWSKLPGLKATDIEMTQLAPQAADDPQQDLTRAAAAAPAPAPAKGGKAKPGLEPDAAWPFPKDKPQQTPEGALADSLGVQH